MVRKLAIHSTLLSVLLRIEVPRMLQVVLFKNESVKTVVHFCHQSNGHTSDSDSALASTIISWNNSRCVCCTRKKKWKVYSTEIIWPSLVKFTQKMVKPNMQKSHSTSCLKIRLQITVNEEILCCISLNFVLVISFIIVCHLHQIQTPYFRASLNCKPK